VGGGVAVSVLAIFAQRCLSTEQPTVNPLADTLDASLYIAASWLLACLIIGLGSKLLQHFARTGAVQTQVGQYTLAEKLGEGGMGVVYKARHALLRRPAAVKLLQPDRSGAENIARFEREVQLTSLLTHPNTISIYDFGRTDAGTFYYVMEYLDGFDLETLIERDGPQDPARTAHLLAQLCGSLHEAHEAGLIHRDVKPANVMVCQRAGNRDMVKVLDFGLIKQQGISGDVTCVDADRIVGTPLYLSPEALTSPASVSAKSDLYAVGAVGYFLLTGQPPFLGNNLLEVCGHHLHTAPVPPSQRLGKPLPRELEALILSCLSKSPSDRPESAAALQKALLRFAAHWTSERAESWWSAHQPELQSRDSAALDVTEVALQPSEWPALAA
jgi:serine/threonine-protein kinase